MLHTKTKGIVPQVAGFVHPNPIKVYADNLHDSAIAKTLVAIVLGDNALTSVSIILPRQAKRRVLRLILSREKRRHIEKK